jgi:hypothetical protein
VLRNPRRFWLEHLLFLPLDCWWCKQMIELIDQTIKWQLLRFCFQTYIHGRQEIIDDWEITNGLIMWTRLFIADVAYSFLFFLISSLRL